MKNTFFYIFPELFMLPSFAEKKFSIEFFNKLEGKKYLEFEVPDLNTSININFDSKSNLDNMSGELRFKILETIVLE